VTAPRAIARTGTRTVTLIGTLIGGVLAGLLLLLPGCSDHGIAGNWNVDPRHGPIEHVEFDARSDAAIVGVDDGSGGDEHLPFRYAVRDGAVTLTGTWRGKEATWRGRLAGDVFELSGPDGEIVLRRGAHGR
jgi:hypothetical protein